MSSEANAVEACMEDQRADQEVHSVEAKEELAVVLGIGGSPGETLVHSTDEIKEIFREKYTKFFHKMSFDLNASDYFDLDEVDKIYTALCKVRSSNHFSSPIPENFLRGSCGYPALVIRFRSFEDKVKIAHATALVTAIDTTMSSSTTMGDHHTFKEDLSLFHLKSFNTDGYEKLYPNRGPLHPLLEELSTYLRTDLNLFFTQPRHLSVMIACILQFLEICQLECDFNDRKDVFEVNEVMVKLPEFIRAKSGLSELYALFQLSGPHLVHGQDHKFFYRHLYPMIPEYMDAVNFLNDYLSFYKEAQAGEVSGYIFIQARVKQTSPMEAIDEALTRIIDIKGRVMVLVEQSGSLEVKKELFQFFNGFIAWHIWWNRRYKLQEILCDWHKGQCI